MKPTEKLAILTALKKAVDDELKNVREIANEELLDAYEDIGAEKLALKVEGQKVGDFIISFSKESYEITDQNALNEFALDYGFGKEVFEIKPEKYNDAIAYIGAIAPDAVTKKVELSRDWEKGITYIDGECCYLDSGMVIPGIKYVPKMMKNTSVRGCKPEDVLPIMRRIGGIDSLLLEGE